MRARRIALALTRHPFHIHRQEADGRWIADVPALRGALAYGATQAEARTHVSALACRGIADLIEHGEAVADQARSLFAPGVTNWPSVRAAKVYLELNRIGWTLKRQAGLHRVLARTGWPDLASNRYGAR
jgi:predicted RNase H-like HicB family nuclease